MTADSPEAPGHGVLIVDDDDIVTPTHGHAVHSELAQAAEGYDVQFSSWHAVH